MQSAKIRENFKQALNGLGWRILSEETGLMLILLRAFRIYYWTLHVGYMSPNK